MGSTFYFKEGCKFMCPQYLADDRGRPGGTEVTRKHMSDLRRPLFLGSVHLDPSGKADPVLLKHLVVPKRPALQAF